MVLSFFNGIIVLQSCGFCYTTIWISCKCTYISSLLEKTFFNTILKIKSLSLKKKLPGRWSKRRMKTKGKWGIFCCDKNVLYLYFFGGHTIVYSYQNSEEPEIKLPTLLWSLKKARELQKTSISALLTMPKPLTVWITINCGKFFKRLEYQTTWPASWEICKEVKKQQLELDME